MKAHEIGYIPCLGWCKMTCNYIGHGLPNGMHQPQLNPVPPRIGNGVRVLQELHPPRNWYRNCDMYIYIQCVYIYSIHIIPPLTNSSIWADGMMEWWNLPSLSCSFQGRLTHHWLPAHLICSKVLKRSAKAKGINPQGMKPRLGPWDGDVQQAMEI